MTLLNYSLGPTRAFVATDTLAYDHEGKPLGFTSKQLTVPHLGVVVADRGCDLFALESYAWLSRGAFPDKVDSVLAEAPEALADLYDPVFGSAEIAMFGWSEAQGRVLGYRFVKSEGFAAVALPDGFSMTPEPDAQQPDVRALGQANGRLFQKYRHPDSMVLMARLQRMTRKWKTPIGGELNCTEVTRHGIETKTIWRFEDAVVQRRPRLADSAA